MKNWIKVTTILFLSVLSISGFAQNIEVNPSVQWRFVRSQSMNLIDGLWYDFEFPAEKGYDYALVIKHNLDTASLYMSVFDMQGAVVFSNELESRQKELHNYFDVKHTSTYKIVLNLSSGFGIENRKNEVQLSLIRRLKIR